ncbi:2,3,4,5-tetrahydropyridine-2,6-dicarboxylate N-succinyltransferase, partial [Acinetobacter baumannii]
MTQALQALIDPAWEDRASLSPKSAPADIREAVATVIGQLD